MISPIDTKDIIEAKIFVPLGTTALWSVYLGPSTDMYGDDVISSQFAASTSLTVVPANYVNTDQIFFQFGNLQKGEQDFIARPGIDIYINDKLSFQGTNYKVKAIKDYVLSDVTIFRALRCVEFI